MKELLTGALLAITLTGAITAISAIWFTAPYAEGRYDAANNARYGLAPQHDFYTGPQRLAYVLGHRKETQRYARRAETARARATDRKPAE